LRSSGYEHFVQAPSADAHVLAAESAVFAGERLHVLIASRLPLRQSAKVAMTAGGYAAFAEVEIAPRKTVLVYTLHCSVRCAAEVRRQEVEAVLHHAAGLEHTTPSADAPAPHQRPRVIGHIVGGDFNQPNEAEYPPGEWRAISKDLAAAGLPASDGVMDAMRAARFTPAWELATPWASCRQSHQRLCSMAKWQWLLCSHFAFLRATSATPERLGLAGRATTLAYLLHVTV